MQIHATESLSDPVAAIHQVVEKQPEHNQSVCERQRREHLAKSLFHLSRPS